ncbi:MAG: TauD/TfdA family dioxygenase [Halioglobus sp.]|nr:TauD/TfdA family dioxygenase [Halioglobus sp.]
MTTIAVEHITPRLGARIEIPADRLLDDGVPEQILATLDDRGVLLFPGINVPDDTLVALSARMGEMKPARVTADGSSQSEQGIYRIALDKREQNHLDYVRGNDYWHMDGASYPVPGKATLLKCEVPPASGGETDFANLYAAYDALPNERKRTIEGLRVIHCLETAMRRFYHAPTDEDIARWNAVFPPTEQPLVWHQKNGRTSLVIGSTATTIVGMPFESGRALLDDLLDWCTRDEFTYSHRWQKGDLVIFNNPGLLHRSRPYDEAAGRVLHRTTLAGHEAFA